jgi:hypothetical protein
VASPVSYRQDASTKKKVSRDLNVGVSLPAQSVQQNDTTHFSIFPSGSPSRFKLDSSIAFEGLTPLF